MPRTIALFAALLSSGCSLLAPDDAHFVGGSSTGGLDGGAGGDGGWTLGLACGPLAAPDAPITDVTPADAATLPSIVSGAASGTTIRLADGTYPIGATLVFSGDGVTLRSASDDATKVVLDGQGAVGTIARIGASAVTLAHVTLTGGTDAGVEIVPSGGDIQGARLYGVHLIDAGQHTMRVATTGTAWADDGRVECSLLRLDAIRPAACCVMCAPNAIEIIGGRGWQIRSTRFEGIHCNGPDPLPFGVIAYAGARDTLVENNVFVDVGRGIGLGFDPTETKRTYPDVPLSLSHVDGIVRNNVIWSDVLAFDTGIELNDTRTPVVVHNTVLHGGAAIDIFKSIDFRYSQTLVVVKNNLTSAAISPRDGAMGDANPNLASAPLSSVVDAAGGDYHLTPGATAAIDQGALVAEAGVDIDGQAHDLGAGPDMGADEHAP